MHVERCQSMLVPGCLPLWSVYVPRWTTSMSARESLSLRSSLRWYTLKYYQCFLVFLSGGWGTRSASNDQKNYPNCNSAFIDQQNMSSMCLFFLSFIYQLLNHHVVTELMLIDVLMNNMMERISDPCCIVRMLAVRGLGNIAVGSPEKVKHAHTHNRTRPLIANIFVRTFGHSSIFLLLCSLLSATRWINMPRSCWQPWVQAWRRKTIQVSWQQSPFLWSESPDLLQ